MFKIGIGAVVGGVIDDFQKMFNKKMSIFLKKDRGKIWSRDFFEIFLILNWSWGSAASVGDTHLLIDWPLVVEKQSLFSPILKIEKSL